MAGLQKFSRITFTVAATAAVLFSTGCQSNGETKSDDQTSTSATESTIVEEEQSTDSATSEETEHEEATLEEPISTSNGGYTITPMGEWTGELFQEGPAFADDHDPQEIISVYDPTQQAVGSIYVGYVTAFELGVELERDTVLQAFELPQLDSSRGPAYMNEAIYYDNAADKYVYLAFVGTQQSPQVAPEDVAILFSDRYPGAYVEIRYTPEGTGEPSRMEVEDFLASDLRSDGIEMMRTLTVAPVQP